MTRITSGLVAALCIGAWGLPARADDPTPTPAPGTAPAPATADGARAPTPAAPVVSVPTFENKTCPIMGKPASKALFVDTEKGRLYVCCPPCVGKIKADLDRAYSAAYPVLRKAGNTVDPVTGEAIGDKPVLITLQGYEVALANEGNTKRAQANAQIVLVKALDPKVVDLGNETDPTTGVAVVDNAFVLVDKDLIHLSSPKSVEAVRKDPEKARKAAKESAAKVAEAREKEKAKSSGK
jgi:hypothetical protein